MAKVAVIGGGPAGMLAAARCAANGHDVTLFERNEKTGKKLFITGKGRCNLTNACDMDAFFSNIPRNPRFLYSAFSALDNRGLGALMESLGVPLKTERGGRMFPQSDKSSDVLRALNRHMEKEGVRVCLNSPVDGVNSLDGRVCGITIEGAELAFDAVILACGGVSYPSTGSTGDGYSFAARLGHSITKITPSLVPLETEERWPGELMGLSLVNVRLTANCGGKVVFSELGEMLFTHFGVSGPLVLSASACIDMDKPTALYIDLKPALSQEVLDARLLRDFQAASRKRFINSMSGLLPSRLMPVIAALSGIDPQTPVSEITRTQREGYRRLLKALPVTVKGPRPIEEAIITRGGVSVKEVTPSTMESKLVKGLYFAGEMLDVDGYTGGFNLQIAFSTGYLAGMSAE